MVRFQIVLNSEEAEALNKWANSEYRDPRDQVRFLIKRELMNLGFLASDKGENHQSVGSESSSSTNKMNLQSDKKEK